MFIMNTQELFVLHFLSSSDHLLPFLRDSPPAFLSRFEKFVIFLRHIYKNTTQKLAIYGPQNRKWGQ